MMISYIIFIPLLVIILMLLFKGVKPKNIFNGLFWGVLVTLFVTFVCSFIPFTSHLEDLTLSMILLSFLEGALPEELFKFLILKFSCRKSKNPNYVFINAVLIGATFMVLENVLYSSAGIGAIFSRILQPGHLFFQVVMALCIMRGLKKNKVKFYSFLGLLLALLSHQAFNTLHYFEFLKNGYYVIGILTYLFVIVYILKMKKNELKEDVKFKVIKAIAVIIIFLFFAICCLKKVNGVNQDVKISDGVTLKISNYECHENKTKIFATEKYECIVKANITNRSNAEFITYRTDYNLVLLSNKEITAYNIDGEYEIQPNESKDLIITFYCDQNNANYLLYRQMFSLDSYSIKLK